MKKKTRSELLKEINDIKKICKNCEHYNIAFISNKCIEIGVCLNNQVDLSNNRFCNWYESCILFEHKQDLTDNLIEIDTSKEITKSITPIQEINEDKQKLEIDIYKLIEEFIKIHPCMLNIKLSYRQGSITNDVSLLNVKIDLTI